MVTEETNGLPENFREEGIAQIGDGRVANVVDFGDSQVLGYSLGKEYDEQGEGKDRPDIVNALWKEVVQVNGVVVPREGN